MEALFTQVEWLPVLVSTAVAFLVGWAWYSPSLFLKSWLAGIPAPPKWQAPMWMPMVSQLGSLLFLSIIVQELYGLGNWFILVLLTFTIMGFSKASGMYSGKTKTAISVEVLYLLVSVLIMVLVNAVL